LVLSPPQARLFTALTVTGVSAGNMAAVFPNVSRFATADLGCMT